MNMRAETETDLRVIMSVFSGEDGGGAFAQFRNLIENLDAKAVGGDRAAEQVLDVMRRFVKLLHVAERNHGRLKPKD